MPCIKHNFMHLCRVTCSKFANPNFLCPCQLFNQSNNISDPESESHNFGSETDPKETTKLIQFIWVSNQT